MEQIKNFGVLHSSVTSLLAKNMQFWQPNPEYYLLLYFLYFSDVFSLFIFGPEMVKLQ